MSYEPLGKFGKPSGKNRFDELYAGTIFLQKELLLQPGAMIRSINFVSGSSGFRLLYDGTAEFNDVTIRGTIYATAGELGDLDITGTLTFATGGVFRTASSGQRLEIDTTENDRIRFYSGASGETYPGTIRSHVPSSGYGQTSIGAPEFNVAGVTAWPYVSLRSHDTTKGFNQATIAASAFSYMQIAESGLIHFSDNGSVPLELRGTQAQFANGSATDPSITFISDDDTGMFRYTTNVLSFATAGTEWIRLSNVGAFRMGNKGTVGSPAIQFIVDGDTGIYSSSANTLNFATGGTQALQLSSSQRVKIVDGTEAAPALTFINDTNTGIRRITGDSMGLVAGGRDVVRVREVSSREYIDFTDTGELWWYGDQAYASTSNRAYRWWINTGSFDTFTLNVRDTAGNYFTNLEFVDGKMRIPETYNRTSGSATNIYMSSSGELFRSTSARKYKSRITYNVDYLADITLAPAKFYRKDSKSWFYGFIADDLSEQDPMLGDYNEDGEVENYDTAELLAVMAAKINRLEAEVKALKTAA